MSLMTDPLAVYRVTDWQSGKYSRRSRYPEKEKGCQENFFNLTFCSSLVKAVTTYFDAVFLSTAALFGLNFTQERAGI